SLDCLIEALEQLPQQRRVAVYSAAGDRRDGDLIRQAAMLGDAFDRVILYEDPNCIRGRKDGEITALFRRGMAGTRRVREIGEVQGAVKARQAAVESARPGEVLPLHVDIVDETIDWMREYVAAGRGREIDFQEAAALGQPETAAAFASAGNGYAEHP